MNNLDMTDTIEPKSNQTNYDDFISGPKTITITDVKPSKEAEQPVCVHYDGDKGKPFKPCKSMRRVMVAAWGVNAIEYVGKSMTLYGDPKVKWAGKEVGGIRISHMSHIKAEMNIALTASKGRRLPHKILPLTINIDVSEDEQETPPDNKLYGKAQEAAEKGIDTYKAFYVGLTAPEKEQLNSNGDHAKLKDRAVNMKPSTDF